MMSSETWARFGSSSDSSIPPSPYFENEKGDPNSFGRLRIKASLNSRVLRVGFVASVDFLASLRDFFKSLRRYLTFSLRKILE